MKILGIETSCDETSASVVKNGKEIFSLVTASQIESHKLYGGVVPELASRIHAETISNVVKKALLDANTDLKDIDYIAVTNGPGLLGSLLVGVCFANALAMSLQKKCIPINHLEAHIYSAFMEDKQIPLPAIALLVSGGHTITILVESIGIYKTIGQTLDDAAGEAFDKISNYLGLGYPGGPAIEKASDKGNPQKFSFPRAMSKHKRKYDFSFSGLKTAVINEIKKLKKSENFNNSKIFDIAASFQQAVVDSLVSKTILAAKDFNAKSVILAGGVAANKNLRKSLNSECRKIGLYFSTPSLKLCGDNGAMVAGLAFSKIDKAVNFISETNPSLPIENGNFENINSI